MNTMAKLPTVTTSTHNHAAASVMARILSSENISVVVNPAASTASFDLANRVLYLPEWKDMSRNVYDMLIGHEISHALHTPADGWRSTCDSISGTTDISSPEWRTASLYLNVVEDARIERLVKDKFPGFKRDFVTAYNELAAKDFFGVKKIDLNTLTLPDRLNLYYKLGTIGSVGIRFTADEQQFISRIDAAKSFDEISSIAADLYKFCKEQQAKQQQQQKQPQSVPNNSDSSDNGKNDTKAPESKKGEKAQDKGPAQNMKGSGDQSDSSDQKDQTSAAESSSDGDEQQERPQSQSPSAPAAGTGAAPTPITQQAFNDALQQSVKKPGAYETPDIIAPTELVFPDLSKVVIDYKTLVADSKTDAPGFFNPVKAYDQEYRKIILTADEKFVRESKRSVDLLIKQFELRKAAQVSKRAAIRNTGVLDTVRMTSYKWSDDIFRRNTILPEGKNHGLVMYVDWSGSMSCNLLSVLEQTYVLCDFCRRAGIPFEVYAFTTRSWSTGTEYTGDPSNDQNNMLGVWGKDSVSFDRYRTPSPKNGRVLPTTHYVFSLLNLFSSRMSKQEYIHMRQFTRALASVSHTTGYMDRPTRWDLSGTALDEAIVSAMLMVPKFKADNRLDIVNTVFLTDGETSVPYCGKQLVDPKTRAVYSTGELDRNSAELEQGRSNYGCSTNVLLLAFREITGSRAIGMYLTSHPSMQPCTMFPKRVAKQLPISEQILIARGHNKTSGYFRTEVIRHSAAAVQDDLIKEFKANNMVVTEPNTTGYDEFFIIKSNVKVVNEDEFKNVEVGASQMKLKRAFAKSFGERNKNRTLVNRFIELIAR